MSDFVFQKGHGMENFPEFHINFKDTRRIYLNIPQFICLVYWDLHKEYIKFETDELATIAKKTLKEAYMNRSYKLAVCTLILN